MKKQTLRAMPAALSIRAAMTTASALATAVIPAALWAADVLLWPWCKYDLASSLSSWASPWV